MTIRFVMGQPTPSDGALSNEEILKSISDENEIHGDILLLDVEENMNKGKTYHYFKYMSQLKVCFHLSAAYHQSSKTLKILMVSTERVSNGDEMRR